MPSRDQISDSTACSLFTHSLVLHLNLADVSSVLTVKGGQNCEVTSMLSNNKSIISSSSFALKQGGRSGLAPDGKDDHSSTSNGQENLHPLPTTELPCCASGCSPSHCQRGASDPLQPTLKAFPGLIYGSIAHVLGVRLPYTARSRCIIHSPLKAAYPCCTGGDPSMCCPAVGASRGQHAQAPQQAAALPHLCGLP